MTTSTDYPALYLALMVPLTTAAVRAAQTGAAGRDENAAPGRGQACVFESHCATMPTHDNGTTIETQHYRRAQVDSTERRKTVKPESVTGIAS